MKKSRRQGTRDRYRHEGPPRQSIPMAESGWRPHKRDRTEDSIVKTAYRLFEEHGYDETTVEAIATASGVATQTFYRYFASKDMILAINGFRSVEHALDRLQPDAPISELARRLAEAIEHSLGYQHIHIAGRLLDEHPDVRAELPTWRAQWAYHLADGLAAAAGRQERSASDRFRARMAMVIVGLAVDERLRRGGEAGLCQLTEETLLVLGAGLGEPPDSRFDERPSDTAPPPSRGADESNFGSR